ncbi:arf-GAP domain and FG repeat-containing protein 1 [Belonocnema kinseyi]|uniref:arf-GAP domain and FG repeat-containing protein 1 n=1 Tax=Belonocnema kinseyi TaxID=2817044 RepID=UPI00143D0BF4|nr:arf-GAP domain and FG repeat-containing protein 1 [Belonocnema kinseyi]
MASAKRKQDEKNLKTLRELVSQSGNKECFDCRQPGPSYVNMTIGSFCCMSCSGILRGLTPPHRVKSISMATFTQEEIDFLKERGNEYCRRIWLGLLHPDGSLPNVNTKDEQKMKDLMSEKYEMKRYYLNPSIASEQKNQSKDSNNQSSSSSLPRVPNSNSNFNSGTAPSPPPPAQNSNTQKQNSKPSENMSSFPMDFVADFSKVPDPYLPPTPTNFNQPTVVPQPSFANFDNNPIFSSPKSSTGTSFNTPAGCLTPNFNGVSSPPSEDRYAALKDLDCMMKQAQLKEENLTSGSTWNTNSNSNVGNSVWGGCNNHASQVISNPFSAGDLWQPSNNLVNNNMQIADNTLNNSANPFRQIQFPVSNGGSFDTLWASKESRNNEDVISSSQRMTSFPSKTWHANPFVVGSSNNPFL